MSTEAVTWAMDDAPMLLTDKGKPDTTARNVLQVLGEHAHKDGGGAHPSVLRIQYRTGFDRRTVQRALKRLETGGLIRATGQVNGRTVWALSLHLKRPASDWSDLERGEEEERRAAAERQRRSRAKRVTHSASVTVTHSDDVSHALQMRNVTHSASARHALNAALTTNQPSEQPPATVAEVGGDSYPSQGPALPAAVDYGIPADARPLLDALSHAHIHVRWPFKNDAWFPVLALIQKCGIPAMVNHATRAVARNPHIDSARYFLPGWRELPPLPTTAPPAMPSNVVHLPTARPSTTDMRVQAAIEAGRRLQALADQNQETR